MAGNEGIKSHPESQIRLESGHLLELEDAEATRMIGLISPGGSLSEKSIEGLSDEEIVGQYQKTAYGYRRFTRIKGDLVVKGQEGKGRRAVFVDIKIPGTVYFNGVLENLESYLESSSDRTDQKSYSDWANRARERAAEMKASQMIHLQRHVGIWEEGSFRSMGNFDTYFFGPDDMLLQEGHPDVHNFSTGKDVSHPETPLLVGKS